MKFIGILNGWKKDMNENLGVTLERPLIEIKLDKHKKILKIEILDFMTGWKRATYKISKKLAKKLDDNDDDKPIDTSTWVKPDEESLKNNLLKHLVGCLVFKQESKLYEKSRTSAKLLWSILKSKAPSNPQTLVDYSLDDKPLINLYQVLDNKTKMNYYYKKLMSHKKLTNPIETQREKYQEWIDNGIKEMVTVKNLPKQKKVLKDLPKKG